jgi:hypothetical protein
VLNDGYVAGVWRIARDRESGGASLVVDHVVPLSKRAAAHDVRFVAVE